MRRPTFITWEQLKVGSLILIALGVLAVAVLKLGEAARLFSRRYTLVTFLANASGLQVGGSVTVAGVLVGTVRSIDLLPPDNDTTRNLVVLMDIDRAVQAQVRRDSRARLRTLGLLGDKVIDISPGTPRQAELRDGDTLRLSEALDYDAVLTQAAGAVGDVVALTHDLRLLTGRVVSGEGTIGQLVSNRALYDQITATLGRANAMLARVQNANGTLGRLIDDPTLYRDAAQMVVAVDSLVRQVSGAQGTVGKLLRDDTLYYHLVGVAAGADSMVKQVARGNGLVGRMLTDQQLYDQLLKAVTDLNAILADVRRDPQRYMKGMIKVF